MERESFEDPEVAGILNRSFISVKVDREERPDVDHIYMSICQSLTGHGGWPLTIIMTPDKKPFYAGTYFPKHDRMGMPGLTTILNAVIEMWDKDSSSLKETAEQIADAAGRRYTAAVGTDMASRRHRHTTAAGTNITTGKRHTVSDNMDTAGRKYATAGGMDAEELIHHAFHDYKTSFDRMYGGFGTAPKFPAPHNLYFLLRYWYVYKEGYALEMVEKTLDSMYRGGIFDHISGGFSRYSTDRKWLVPHFEKMLYDNALLAIAYLEAYQATKNTRHAEAAKKILTYVLRDMTSPEGGFYSAEDADSEGTEGKFYTWSEEEVKQVLGDEDGKKYCEYYDITQKGNFEDTNIPNLIKGPYPEDEQEFIENCRQKLFDYREKRIHPYKDDKILTSWNGLMIAAMAVGGKTLGEERYTAAAEKAVWFISEKLVTTDGRLLARYRDKDAAFPAYVDDYAFLTWGLIELYEATYNPEYLQKAVELDDELLKLFWDNENGGFFLYGSDSEQLIARPKEIYDGAAPSGNSAAAFNLLRLARLTGRHELEERANLIFDTFGNEAAIHPSGYSFFLNSMLFSLSTNREVIIVGNSGNTGMDEMLGLINEGFRPFTTSVLYTPEHEAIKQVVPFIANYTSVNGLTTAYVCSDSSCSYPLTDMEHLKEMLQ